MVPEPAYREARIKMKRQSPEELRNELVQGSFQGNLNLIVWFHNEFRDDLRTKLTEGDKPPNTTTDIELLDEMLRRTTFVLMYSHIEEWLFHVCKPHTPDERLRSSGGSITRFKPVLKTLGVDLSNDNWGFLCDAEKVRNWGAFGDSFVP